MAPPLKPVCRRAFSFVISLCLLASTCAAIALDTTFGSGGKFTTTFSDTGDPHSTASRVFVQPSGRIVVVGRHQQQGSDGRVSGIALVGLTTSGSLDTNFGTGGKVLIWNSAGHSLLTDAHMLTDGSLLLLYQVVQPNTQTPILVKYTPNGQPDPSFSADAQIRITPATQSVRLAPGINGKTYLLLLCDANYFLMRLNSDGSRDGSFAEAGVRSINVHRIPVNQRAFVGMHELGDGKILLTGYYEDRNSFLTNGFAMRFDSDTNVDRSFGRQGVTQISLPNGSVQFTRSTVQPDGKLMLGGYFTFLGSYALLVRLTARGRPDASFGNAGVAMTSFNNVNGINGIVTAPDGKIVVTGTSGDKALPANQRLFVARFSAAGVREDFLLTNFLTNRDAGGADLVIQPDGKLVAAGFSQNATGFFSQLAVARFTP
ncbi:MAG TPA: hypothetical protein VMZ26_06325 [Pyrinomonadaceae bacterium]|nr:hypothetical protein [Pyrinomonadaceae bacterium]